MVILLFSYIGFIGPHPCMDCVCAGITSSIIMPSEFISLNINSNIFYNCRGTHTDYMQQMFIYLQSTALLPGSLELICIWLHLQLLMIIYV